MCFISTIPVHFINSRIKVSKYYFNFISLIFIFHMILQYFKVTPHSELFSVVLPWRGIDTENSDIKGNGIILKDTNSSFGWVLTSTNPSRLGWSRARNVFVWLSPGEKKMGLNQLFLICTWWCIADMSFS